MENFNKKTEPKIIANLSNNHALSKIEEAKPQQMQQPKQPFVKHDSASFKETKIKYENQVSPIPNLNQNGNNRVMPQIGYTKEEPLARPIADKDKRLNIESMKKENLSFSKGMNDPVKSMDCNLKQDYIKVMEEDRKNGSKAMSNIEISPLKKKRKIPIYFLLAIFIELVVLGFILYFKNQKVRTTLECTNQIYNEYYHATIINRKKYFFKKGIITKLEDTFNYTFDNEEFYNQFKEVTANPELQIVEGRTFTSTVNDNTKEYTEKTVYNFSKLRKQNETDIEHTILIHTKDENDTIQLLDYNSTDMRIIYEEDYVCK